jgi:hypothetical protein
MPEDEKPDAPIWPQAPDQTREECQMDRFIAELMWFVGLVMAVAGVIGFTHSLISLVHIQRELRRLRNQSK